MLPSGRDVVKGKHYTDSPLTALLVLLSLGPGRSPGPESSYSWKVRLLLSVVSRGYKMVCCLKSSQGIASLLPDKDITSIQLHCPSPTVRACWPPTWAVGEAAALCYSCRLDVSHQGTEKSEKKGASFIH